MRAPISARRAALLLAAAVAAAGCSGVTKGKEDAERAVAEFHARFDEGRFEAIWDAAGEELRGGTAREEFVALLAAVRRKLGAVTGSTTRGWQVKSVNLRTYVQLVQDTTFADGRATETFRFVVKDGRATLVGYDVSSRDLILR